MIEQIKNIWVYDTEVFCKDWLLVFKSVDTLEVKVFCNDYKPLREWILTQKPILCGFNNKHYDDYILLGILNGNDNEQIKAHNDYIINGGQGFEFIGIKGLFKGDWFKSFDLRDDLPLDLSLKAIEGNLGHNITESTIDFTIDRKLTEEELLEVESYCRVDVNNTFLLFSLRAAYLDGKLKVAKVGNMDPVKALGFTNPKLSATFLGAKPLSEPRHGELHYDPPACLQLNKYTEALDFYQVVDYNESLTIQAKDLELVYGWGGIHGAIEHSSFESSDKFKIVDIDVGSYYPSMIIQLGYVPSSIPSAQGYVDVYNQRINAKHTGDSDTADALKLVLNSTYGALKNQYNALFEPKIANHICISGQLLLTDLIEKLEAIPGLKLIQANTDGLMIGYNPRYEKKVNEAVSDWEQRTKLNMEYTEIKKIIQKDVNNYVMVAGATYLIKDGKHVVTKEDKNKIAVKGSYVSLYKGGDFRNNSLVIVHKCLVNYFLNGTPVEETIAQADNVLDFQMIAKTGSSYKGTLYEVAGDKVPVQRVNRVYASSDPSKGTLYKLKEGGRLDKIASLPEHCLIDNEGDKVKLEDIDKSFYIELAKKRINDYLGNKPEKKKRGKNMATKKTEADNVQEPATSEAKSAVSGWNIYAKLALSKKQFTDSGIKKSGINRYAGFKYFQLDDIIPLANDILLSNGLVFYASFNEYAAVGTLVNIDKPEEKITVTSPMRKLETVSQAGKNKMNEVQGLGAEETYQRRYLYYMLLDIVENDTFDATNGKDENEAPVVPKAAKPATSEERKEIAQEVAKVGDDKANELQKESIKKGLAKLREKGDHEGYISEVVTKMKNGATAAEAEAIISEIGKLLYPGA